MPFKDELRGILEKNTWTTLQCEDGITKKGKLQKIVRQSGIEKAVAQIQQLIEKELPNRCKEKSTYDKSEKWHIAGWNDCLGEIKERLL